LTKFDKNLNVTELTTFSNKKILAALEELAPCKTKKLRDNENGEQCVDETTNREKSEMRRK
jgi:hypothetical protein